MKTSNPMTGSRYDVAILGTGISGTILGAILARNGLRVLLVEQGVHPRFAIGESTIPETTFLFRALAVRYGVPEIAHLSTFSRLRQHIGPSSGIKRNFSFVYHRPDEAQRPEEATQFPTFGPPLGPDVHFFRQDVDAYLLALASTYGATVKQRTEVVDLSFDSELVKLRTKQGDVYEARYVVDAGGIMSPLARMYGLRENPCPFKTRSRSIYTHMLGVRPVDSCFPTPQAPGLPTPLSQGTLHHLFDGGWMWVIGFDNHTSSTNRLCSVGLNLDIDRFPRTGRPPEEEFRSFIKSYPMLAKQFESATAIREWVGTDRLQFSSTTSIGDRYFLMPHAANFIDPLFSSGLSITMSSINQLAHRLLRGMKEDDLSTDRFTFVDTWMKKNFQFYDRLVSKSYFAFSSFKLWNTWQRLWMLGSFFGASAVLEILFRHQHSGDPAAFDAFEEAPYRGLQASDLPEVAQVFDAAERELDEVKEGQKSEDEASARVFQRIRESGMWPEPWGGAGPDRRHTGPLTMKRLFLQGRWIQTMSPPNVRRHYFSVKPQDLIKEAVKDGMAELRHAGSTVMTFAQALAIPWNQEWVREVPEPRAMMDGVAPKEAPMAFEPHARAENGSAKDDGQTGAPQDRPRSPDARPTQAL